MSLTLQLLLVLLVVRTFRLEERRGLFGLMLLAGVGAAISWRLAAKWRAPFFLGLSLVSFPLAFAWPSVTDVGWIDALASGVRQSAWLLGLGLALIGICHLPIPFAGQAALLAGAVVGLAAWRADAVSPFWAILGSIFMFRLWIYWKTIQRDPKAIPWSQRLSYFFMFSNGFFPFFLIVDYRKFRASYVENDLGPVAQRGIAWILRGIIHLLLYRVVKVYFLPGKMDLIDVEYLALFLVTNYALYLRISGHFHIITGLLHLFGYDLPRTHDRYFLASSLSDIWRRINIYWKDFLTDYVFFPVFFSLRRFPKAAAVVVGVLVTFVATWFFHSWQVFWLLGDFPLETRDGALWLSAGTLVAINSLWQYRRALKRTAVVEDVSAGRALRIAMQVVATFLTVSFFWACWTVPHFPRLVSAIARSGGFQAEQLLTLASVLVGVIAFGTIAQIFVAALRHRVIEVSLPLERSPAICIAALGMLTLVGLPQVNRYLGYETAREIAKLQQDAPTAAEAGVAMEGYYEELAEVNLQSDPLLRGLDNDRTQGEVVWTKASRIRSDIVGRELIPGWNGELAGVPFRVNRWGMHDHDYSRRKPSNTHRIAVAGSSATMGLGVPEDANFPSLVERRVNAAFAPESPQVEFMNFASGGYSALQWSAVLREKVYRFDPDALCYVAHQGELRGPTRNLARCYVLSYPRPFPCLDDILQEAGIKKEMSWGAVEMSLEPFSRQTLSCLYRGIVADCRERGIRPVWVYLPLPGVEGVPANMAELLSEIAHKAGFEVIDLSGWEEGHATADLVVDGHYHPSVLGHRLIADEFFEALREVPDVLPRPTDEQVR